MRSGGFAPAGALVLDYDDQTCFFCSRNARFGWIHVVSQSLICLDCMRDPDADGGAAGRRAAERLVLVDEIAIS